MTAVPVLSALTDRIDSRRIYLGACCLSALGAAGFALYAQGLWTALAFQFVIGAGLGGFMRRNPRQMAIYAVGAPT